MTLQRARLSLASRQRNNELLLMAGAFAFLILAWRALSAASFELPAGTASVVVQFVAAGLAGHFGLRLFAPRAAEQPYAVVLLLAAVGLAFVTRLAPEVAQTQVRWVTLGIVGMVVTVAASRWLPLLPQFKYTAAVFAGALLLVTGIFGQTYGGARLWLDVFGQSVQTTELIKLLLLVFLAGYLAEKADVLAAPRIRFGGRTYTSLPYLIPLLGTWVMAMLALALLRDLGTIAILLMLAVSSLYLATGRLRFVIAGFLLLLVTGGLGYLLFDHAQVRIDVWLDPYGDPAGTGYQSLQALYAFQAGGITGEGLGLGQPTAIPAVTTDYIFSAIGEELGMAGATAVLLLFGVLVVAGLRVALAARDDASRLLACGIALLFGIQAAVIIAGNLRVIPTTGITLPFVSYGGSSLIVNFLLLGLLLGVSDRANRQA